MITPSESPKPEPKWVPVPSLAFPPDEDWAKEPQPKPPESVIGRADFAGHSVRIIGDPDAPKWIAADVGSVLGHSNIRKVLADLPAHQKGVTSGYTLGGVQQIVWVTEAGLYSLIFKSRKREALAFQNWVCEEVLPSIRKFGCYPPPKGVCAAIPEQTLGDLRAFLPAAAATLPIDHQRTLCLRLKCIQLVADELQNDPDCSITAACRRVADRLSQMRCAATSIHRFRAHYLGHGCDWKCLVPRHHRSGRHPKSAALPAPLEV